MLSKFQTFGRICGELGPCLCEQGPGFARGRMVRQDALDEGLREKLWTHDRDLVDQEVGARAMPDDVTIEARSTPKGAACPRRCRRLAMEDGGRCRAPCVRATQPRGHSRSGRHREARPSGAGVRLRGDRVEAQTLAIIGTTRPTLQAVSAHSQSGSSAALAAPGKIDPEHLTAAGPRWCY